MSSVSKECEHTAGLLGTVKAESFLKSLFEGSQLQQSAKPGWDHGFGEGRMKSYDNALIYSPPLSESV